MYIITFILVSESNAMVFSYNLINWDIQPLIFFSCFVLIMEICSLNFIINRQNVHIHKNAGQFSIQTRSNYISRTHMGYQLHESGYQMDCFRSYFIRIFLRLYSSRLKFVILGDEFSFRTCIRLGKNRHKRSIAIRIVKNLPRRSPPPEFDHLFVVQVKPGVKDMYMYKSVSTML